MIHRVVRVQGWTVDFLFAHRRNDEEGVMACLYEYGAPKEIARQTREQMDGAPNRGFTFSNSDRRVILTWVGHQSSGAQWVNTTVHELAHIAQAIALDDGMDPFSEDFAYLCGDISQTVADILCTLACDHCRDHLSE